MKLIGVLLLLLGGAVVYATVVKGETAAQLVAAVKAFLTPAATS